mmetsp:Transcript_11735/g.25805  ORF Transcript_11735/g.25805 Transcript_11735/m.25805 type:complete len:99 (-) Transcript_11735:2055-2351(-)
MAVVALVAVVAVTIAGFVAGPVARESPPMLVVVMVVRVLVGSVGSVGIYKGLRPQRCTGNTPVGRCSFSFLHGSLAQLIAIIKGEEDSAILPVIRRLR